MVPCDDGVPTADKAVVDAQLTIWLSADHLGPKPELQDPALQLPAAADDQGGLGDDGLVPAGGGLLASGRRVSSVWAVSHCPAPFDRCVGRPDGSIVAFTFMHVKGIASAKHHMGLVTFSTL